MEANKQQAAPDYHTAIKSVVEHLKSKRKELQSEISNDQEEKAKVLAKMSKLQDKLTIIEANLKKKSEFRTEYDKAILQSEGHFQELMQKSEDFLSRARREALALSHTIGTRESDSPFQKKPCGESKERGNHAEKTSECPSPKPLALLAVKPPEPGSCVGCSSTIPCTTIAVPYRANGL